MEKLALVGLVGLVGLVPLAFTRTGELVGGNTTNSTNPFEIAIYNPTNEKCGSGYKKDTKHLYILGFI